MRKLFFLIIIIFQFFAIQMIWAQKNSFDKIIGKSAVNLEPGSFRFALGIESWNDKWDDNDYSSMMVPVDLGLGLNDNIEIDIGAQYVKSYSNIDGVAIRDKYSYHNLYAGVRILTNPHTMFEKPAIGFWLGMYFPVHKYEAWKPTAQFLLSSAISNLFSWNFNIGGAVYLNKWEYDLGTQKEVYPGAEVNMNIEVGYRLTDPLKVYTGFDMKQHFLAKRYFSDGSDMEIEEFASWRWIGAIRLKPVNLPVILDAGVRVGLNKNAEESFSIFVKFQLIPNASDAVW